MTKVAWLSFGRSFRKPIQVLTVLRVFVNVYTVCGGETVPVLEGLQLTHTGSSLTIYIYWYTAKVNENVVNQINKQLCHFSLVSGLIILFTGYSYQFSDISRLFVFCFYQSLYVDQCLICT